MSKRTPPPPKYEDIKGQYVQLFASAKIRTSFRDGALKAARAIIANRSHYEDVEGLTGVPWWWTGVTHHMESGGSFFRHIHNGDPLTARTVHVPAGRPIKGNPTFKWSDSCVDAFLMPAHQLDKVKDWHKPSVACFTWEKWNGWGYRWFHPNTLSAYLWSGTQHYSSGKYVDDGVWSDSAVSEQVGAVAILKAMLEVEPGLFELMEDAADAEAQAPPQIGPTETTPSSFPKAHEQGPGLIDRLKASWRHVAAALGLGGLLGSGGNPHLPTADQLLDVGQRASNLKPQLMGIVGAEYITPAIVCVALYLLLGHVMPWLFGKE